MGRQSKWHRDFVAKVRAELEAERARNRPPPPRPSTQHAREYQRLAMDPYTPEYYAFTCGARTRAGTPCTVRPYYPNGRCESHGGLSTGPKTEHGRLQSAVNGRRGGRPRKRVNT